jgi:hypothetical protein
MGAEAHAPGSWTSKVTNSRKGSQRLYGTIGAAEARKLGDIVLAILHLREPHAGRHAQKVAD